ALVLCSIAQFAPAFGQASSEVLNEKALAGFRDFLQALWPEAQQKGVGRASFDAAFSGLEPDPSAPSASNRQAEFDIPLKIYVREGVSPRRIARGRECFNEWRAPLADIENRFGVPAAIAVAAFGMESDYGRATGGKDIIRSLATLAFLRQDRPVFRAELLD